MRKISVAYRAVWVIFGWTLGQVGRLIECCEFFCFRRAKVEAWEVYTKWEN